MASADESFSVSKLISQVESNLSEKRLETLFELDNTSFTSLITGSFIPIELTCKSFFSPVFITDSTDTAYPLFFLKSKIKKENNIQFLTRDDKLPIFNHVALKWLADAGVEVDDFTRIGDISSYLLSLEGNIQVANKAGEIQLVKKLGFYDHETMYLNRAYPLLNKLASNSFKDEKYLGLSTQIKNSDIESKISEETKSELFSDYQKVIKRFNAYKGSKLYYNDSSILKNFILHLISALVSSGQKLLFITEDEEEKAEFQKLLQDNDLSDFSLDLKKVSPELLERSIPYQSLSLEEKERYQKFSDSEREYLKLINERNLCYSNPRDIYSKEAIDDIIIAEERKVEPLDLDLSQYSKEDFASDYAFLKKVAGLKTLQNIKLKDHTYYGLSVSRKRQNYDEINLTVIKILSALKEFKNLLASANLKDFEDKEITSLKQFEELGKDIAVLSSYNGFPKKYFRINQEEEVLENLNELKKNMQAISSTKLLIQNICNEKIFSANLKGLLQDLNSHFFLTRYRAKRKLCSYLEVKNKKDNFLPLVKLLKAYVQYVDNLMKVIPAYKEEFGDSINTMNGVIEIESNIRYIYSFHARGKMHPSFTMENPAVKRCYREKSIRSSIIAKYQSVDVKYQELKGYINKFIGFFLDADYPYMQMSFEELSSLCQKILSGSYVEFNDYATFREGIGNTSKLLSINLDKYLKDGKIISDFKYLFLLSLAEAIYKRGRKRFRPHLNDYEEAKKSYLTTLDQTYSLYFHYLYTSILDIVQKEKDEVSYQIEQHQLLEGYKAHEQDYDFEKRVIKFLHITHPIFYCTSDDLLVTPSDISDKVIIFNSKSASIAELLTMMRAGDHLLFIEKISESDKRTFGYPDLAFSSLSFLSLFDFSSLPESFLKMINKQFSNFGFTIKESDIFPLSIYNSEDKIVGAILPDILIPKNKEMQVRSEFRKFMQNVYHLHLLILNTFSFLIDPEQTISSLINRLDNE